jgi:hypothetical protein
MAGANGRSPEQIRAEIRAERAQLGTAAAALGADVKRSARMAGSAVAAFAGLLVLRRLFGRRR